MNWVYYVRVVYAGLDNEPALTELFTIGNNYAEVATQIEEAYRKDLIALSLYPLDADFVYANDFSDYLREGRKIFEVK